MKYGVGTARRAWIEKKDVINALPLKKFLAALRPKPAEARARAAAGSAAGPAVRDKAAKKKSA